MVRKGIDTVNEANRLMQRVRAYHAPSGTYTSKQLW